MYLGGLVRLVKTSPVRLVEMNFKQTKHVAALYVTSVYVTFVLDVRRGKKYYHGQRRDRMHVTLVHSIL